MYSIIRHHQDTTHPDHLKVIKSGLSLWAAQDHCKDPSTHVIGVWFDGYREEGARPLSSTHAIPVTRVCSLFQQKEDLCHRLG
jgi:hypothetical protein